MFTKSFLNDTQDKISFKNTPLTDTLHFTVTGVGTKIDPTLCRADRLVGQVLGAVGALPDIYTELEISYFLLRRLLGVRTEGDKKGAKVSVIQINSRGFIAVYA